MQIRIVFDQQGVAMHISRKEPTGDEPHAALALQWHARSGNSWKSTMRPCYLPLDGAAAILDAAKLFLENNFAAEERDEATGGDGPDDHVSLRVALTDEDRLDAARVLLRDATAALFKDVVDANSSRGTARQYVLWVHNLAKAVVLPESTQPNYFLVRDGEQIDHDLHKSGGAACRQHAEYLGRWADQIQIPDKDASHAAGLYLNPGFMPKPGRSWKDY